MRSFLFRLVSVPAAVLFVPLGYVWQACADCFTTGRDLYEGAAKHALLEGVVCQLSKLTPGSGKP